MSHYTFWLFLILTVRHKSDPSTISVGSKKIRMVIIINKNKNETDTNNNDNNNV